MKSKPRSKENNARMYRKGDNAENYVITFKNRNHFHKSIEIHDICPCVYKQAKTKIIFNNIISKQ